MQAILEVEAGGFECFTQSSFLSNRVVIVWCDAGAAVGYVLSSQPRFQGSAGRATVGKHHREGKTHRPSRSAVFTMVC